MNKNKKGRGKKRPFLFFNIDNPAFFTYICQKHTFLFFSEKPYIFPKLLALHLLLSEFQMFTSIIR